MAACSPIDGDSVDPDNLSSSTNLHLLKTSQGKSNYSDSSQTNKTLDEEKTYDEVASFGENDLKNLLEEVVSHKQKKDDKSTIAQFLLRKEEDAIREESGSGEDTLELIHGRHKRKRILRGRDQRESGEANSAASRTSTGGSLGSLHDLTDPKVVEVPSNNNPQGVASRSRGVCSLGGSCGNLSRGSFKTQPPYKYNKGRRTKAYSGASSSQREGGSLQNLSKAEVASNEAKKLHKSGSLSHVFPEEGRVKSKSRRQKTSSESSSSKYSRRRSEEREATGDTSEEEVGDFPYSRLLEQSPHDSSVSVHSSTDQNDGQGGFPMIYSQLRTEDQFSDAASGETTEEEGENLHYAARDRLGGDCSRHSSVMGIGHAAANNETELHSVVSTTAHKDNYLPTISSDSEVDRLIPFNLSCQEGMRSETSLPFVSTSYVEDKTKEDSGIEKRKLRSTKSDCSSEPKILFLSQKSLDENGNPISLFPRNCLGSSGNVSTSVSPRSSACTDCHPSMNSIAKRSNYPIQTKDISQYDRRKANRDKRKANREKDVTISDKTPGFKGNNTLDDILKFIGVQDDARKMKKKKNKEEKENSKKARSKGSELMFDEFSLEKCKADGSQKMDKAKSDDSSSNSGSDSKEIMKEEEEMKGNEKLQEKEQDIVKNKKGSHRLRESSSVEDLVSKSKQVDNVQNIRKQVTVDDGDVSLSVLPPYQYGKEDDSLEVAQELSLNITSEFSYDFYKIGDAVLEPDALVNEHSGFEVVNRKKHKKNKSPQVSSSQSTRYYHETSPKYTDDHRRATVPSLSLHHSSGKHSSQEKPHLNFSEVPRPPHDGVFFNQWPNSRIGGGERYNTTSAPHSEDSDSDGRDSVHSMPAHAITPRPDVRKPPPSTDTTPQTSYANIAKLAASTNRAQMKKLSNTVCPSATETNPLSPKTVDGEKPKKDKEKRSQATGNVLDDNFPPLTESLSSPPPSSGGGSLTKSTPSSRGNLDLSDLFSSPIDASSISENSLNELAKNLNNSIISSKSDEMPTNQIGEHGTQTEFIIPPKSPASQSNVDTATSNVVTNIPSNNNNNNSSYKNNEINRNCSISNNNNNNSSDNCGVNQTLLPQNKLGTGDNFSKVSILPKDPEQCKGSVNIDTKVLNSIKSSKTKEANIVENGTVRQKKYDAAVIFTDCAKFNHTFTDIEFGFDLSVDTLGNVNDKIVSNTVERTTFSETSSEAINAINSLRSVDKEEKTDFGKLFLPPKNDVVSYNYEELCRHISKAWESTLHMLEDDPKNIQYWKHEGGSAAKETV